MMWGNLFEYLRELNTQLAVGSIWFRFSDYTTDRIPPSIVIRWRPDKTITHETSVPLEAFRQLQDPSGQEARQRAYDQAQIWKLQHKKMSGVIEP